jgi:F0F1-type ATP synthase epsilon subunit
MLDSLSVTVRSSDSLLFQGMARAISSFNEKGPFDVLPMHVNFISIIKKKLIISLPDRQKKEFKINEAVMKVEKNNVQVFCGVEFQREL